jgi:hypothetical protein
MNERFSPGLHLSVQCGQTWRAELTKNGQSFTVDIMRPREIQYYLLSLFVRGLGFWLLYDAAHTFEAALDSLYLYFFPTNPETMVQVIGQLFELAVKLVPAVYFIAGAPPLLKKATQEKFEDRD